MLQKSDILTQGKVNVSRLLPHVSLPLKIHPCPNPTHFKAMTYMKHASKASGAFSVGQVFVQDDVDVRAENRNTQVLW